jgi:cytoskeleton protein RodZ
MSDGRDTMTMQSEGASAGALLKAAREAQGLHIAALAVSLKVPVKKLEALEADRHDLLPDAVFARALASSVCRSLKVDPTDILARLPQTSKPRLSHHEQSINTPFRLPADGPGPSPLALLKRPVVLAVVALLLGALVLIVAPNIHQKTAEVASAALSELRSSTMAGASTASDTSGTAMGTGTPVYSSADGTVTNVPNVSISNVTPSVALSTSLTSTTAIATVSTSTATVAPADSLIVFRVKAESSWIEVIDVRGQIVVRRNLQAGESVGANGATPLRVTVGRADQTQVFVRGQAFEDDSRVRDNVLRFEVR